MEFISHSTEQTRRAGMRLGSLLQRGDLILLIGELGAGKTSLVQGICSGWGSLDNATSPTFVLVNVYRRPDSERLYHLDAYRLNSATEAESLDIDAYIENGPLVIEWADRILSVLPEAHLKVYFSWIDEDQRDLIITAHGKQYDRLLAEFRKLVFGVK